MDIASDFQGTERHANIGPPVLEAKHQVELRTGANYSMPVIDADAILKQITENADRLRALGVSKEREDTYYSDLSMDGCDPDRDETTFRTVVDGLSLSENDRAFVKRVLDSGDGR